MAWVHGGLTVGPADEIVTFDQGTGELVILGRAGDPASSDRRIPTPARVGHGLTWDSDSARPGV